MVDITAQHSYMHAYTIPAGAYFLSNSLCSNIDSVYSVPVRNIYSLWFKQQKMHLTKVIFGHYFSPKLFKTFVYGKSIEEEKFCGFCSFIHKLFYEVQNECTVDYNCKCELYNFYLKCFPCVYVLEQFHLDV